MTISPELESKTPAFVCAQCGSRLSRNDEPDALEVGSDSLRTSPVRLVKMPWTLGLTRSRALASVADAKVPTFQVTRRPALA